MPTGPTGAFEVFLEGDVIGGSHHEGIGMVKCRVEVSFRKKKKHLVLYLTNRNL